ncbi:MAG: CHAT domain-containing tetratricopeptide repeat protein [Acidobacteriota bacterium]
MSPPRQLVDVTTLAGRDLPISEGTTQHYLWLLEAGVCGRLSLEQRGVDLVMRLVRLETDDTSGPEALSETGDVTTQCPPPPPLPVRVVDGLTGSQGTERAVIVVEETTALRIELEPTGPLREDGGTYRLTALSAPASQADRDAAAGDEHFDRAERLRRTPSPGTAFGDTEADDAALDDARALYGEAYRLFTRAGDDDGVLLSLHRLGHLAVRRGRRSEAEQALSLLLETARQTGHRDEAVRCLGRLGHLALDADDTDTAQAHFADASRLAAVLDNPVLRAVCLENEALLLQRREDLAGALFRLDEACELYDAAGRPRLQAIALHNTAQVLRAQGQIAEAIDSLERALTLRGGLGAPIDHDVLASRLLLGDLLRANGRPEDAVRHLEDTERATQTSQGCRLSPELQMVLANDLGLALAEAGTRDDDATRRFDKALELAGPQHLDRPRAEGLAALNLAYLQRLSDPERARRLLERARRRLEPLGDQRHLAACNLVDGLLLREAGDSDAAREQLERSIEAVESLRSRHDDWSARQAFFATRQRAYDELVELYLARHARHAERARARGEPVPEADLAAALHVSERRRARGLLDGLAESRLVFRGDPELLANEAELSDELAEVESLLRQMPASVAVEPSRRRRELLRRLDTLRAEIRRSSPQYAALTRPHPLTLETIRTRVLDDSTVLLVYALGESTSHLWVVERGRPARSLPLAGRRTIDRAVDEARHLLQITDAAQAPHVRAELGRITHRVLGDFARRLDDRRLAIVPDGALHALPFAALVEPRPPHRWLIEGREVVVLPSASALEALRREQARRPQPRRHLILFADPVFDASDPRLGDPTRAASTDEGSVATLALRRAATGGSRLRRGAGLPRLPASAEEARRIAPLAPASGSRILEGFDADRAAFESAELAEYRIVHIASHGLLDAQHPELSGFVLSLVDADGRPTDGFLRAHELYRRRLAADLVVLSACRTGLGSIVHGEGLVGLPYGFLYGAVPRVVVSLWQVLDNATAELMVAFYEHLRAGRAPAAALAHAQRALLASDDVRLRLPAAWAPFVLVGEWRGIDDEVPGDDDFGAPDEGSRPRLEPGKSGAFRFELPADALDDTDEELDQTVPFVNGIDLDTGVPLDPELPAASADEVPTAKQRRRLQHWTESYAIDDPDRRLMYGIDPEDLAQAGWGVIFGRDVEPTVRAALRPLLEHRRRQAGRVFREIEHDGSSGLEFLERHGVAFGPAVPDKLPYYLLVIGDPATLPFEFQYQLDVQHAVGRLHFDTADEYARYAASVVATERRVGASSRDGLFWWTDPPGDPQTRRMSAELCEPLLRALARSDDRLLIPRRAADGRRATLLRHLEEAPPALLFTASHGGSVDAARDPSRQRELQGALIGEEWWQGSADGTQEVPGKALVAATDLPPNLALDGMIAVHFACYSAGCSQRDPFARGLLGGGARLAESAFVSRLAQRLLSSGAQAVVGHVDRAWTTSFSWSAQEDSPRVFISMLRQLLAGHRLGHAADWVHERYAECATALADHLDSRNPAEDDAAQRLARLRKVTLDTRNYLVLGDPAVRLVGAGR